MKKRTKTALIVFAALAMLGAAGASYYQNTPKQKLLRFLKQGDYAVIRPVSVQCDFDKNGTAATAAEIRFEYSVNEREQTDSLIRDVFQARGRVERYLDQNAEHFPDPYVRCVFQDAHDSSATHMYVANYAGKEQVFAGYRAKTHFQLDLGYFDAEYGALSAFENAPPFTALYLSDFRESDLSALSGQTGLQRLTLSHCADPGESANTFLEAHPDCELSINGETIQTAKATKGE